ncbi:glycoside hydrolase family 3 protein [Actinomyces faecalis]|uniref:glycoside hydrolase family 3 protein n=1 Tax=Actinomyces faecalis TaxID=2722820 RepID=UPI001553BF8A|nr:glycoside hydrolase family 3 protein [Actinomyces faecalis]
MRHVFPSADSRSRMSRRAVIGATALVATAAAGTTAALAWLRKPSPAPTAAPAPSSTPSATPSAPAAPEVTPTAEAGADPVAGWSIEQTAGQLLMVGVPATGSARAVDSLLARHVGGVFLSGRSSAGVAATRALVDDLTARATAAGQSAPLLIATDQEGGNVQVLSGTGFTRIPEATTQGTWSAEELSTAASGWAGELAAAGVTMNLAPVADLVDVTDPSSNTPIGHWDRQYGAEAGSVTEHVVAFNAGMRQAGVVPVIKHFPGLGRTVGNTDVTAHVTDSVTTRGDAALGVFAQAIAAGTEAVMVSSAFYSLIDPEAPAVFSPTVVTELLRGEMGFTGVVVTDDVAAAVQVQAWSPAQRAVLAVRAGCDIVLASADSSVAPAMLDALIAEAQADPAFAEQVAAAARRVLTLKAQR